MYKIFFDKVFVILFLFMEVNKIIYFNIIFMFVLYMWWRVNLMILKWWYINILNINMYFSNKFFLDVFGFIRY